MELPKETASLYRHWKYHTEKRPSSHPKQLFANPAYFANMESFMEERQRIWEKKTRGESPPYTNDPVLSAYRFCNTLRECDRQTIAFHTLLNPLRDNFPLWLMNMYYCRLVARPETIHAAGLLSRDIKDNEHVFSRLTSLTSPKYGTPYVFPVSTILKSSTPTRELLVTKHVPKAIPKVAALIKTWSRESIAEKLNEVCAHFGFSHHFLWTEVLIDTAYQFPEYIDLFKRFPVGPGALPTCKLISPNQLPEDTILRLSACHHPSSIRIAGAPVALSAENWEGIACEFRKYSNLAEGSGRKRIYRPKEEGGQTPPHLF